MNATENKIIELLRDLKENHNVIEVKAEFEAEATRVNELIRLKDLASRAGLGLVLKIGGAEAITDMFEAQHIGVTGLIAPMIESAHAMKKYLQAIKKHFSEDQRQDIHFGANIETHQAYLNFKDMLVLEDIKLIDTITIGRVDMVGSLNLSRKEINSNKIYTIVEEIFIQSRKKGLRNTMGGAIEPESIPFINKLRLKKLIDRFETRKVVFQNSSNINGIEKGILKAHRFELLWLQNKRNYYNKIFREDEERIDMLMGRLLD